MACTTILVGKHASYDGSTMIARNDDSGSGHFTPKKFVVIHPEDQKRIYRSVLSHVEVELPEHPYQFTAVPNAVAGKGIWAASGVNEKNVAMTATETITSNPRVLGADPLVPGGIGEEDLLMAAGYGMGWSIVTASIFMGIVCTAILILAAKKPDRIARRKRRWKKTERVSGRKRSAGC